MKAEEALRSSLRELRDRASQQLDGVLLAEGEDPVHDLRVACRRARSLLKVGKRALPAAPRRDLMKGLKWMGRITGVARDLDVLIGSWELYRQIPASASGAVELGTDLDRVIGVIRSRRAQRYRLLGEQLLSPEARTVWSSWRALLDPSGAGDGERATRETDLDAATLARRAAGDRLQRFRSGADQARATGGRTDLHRLRIQGKELRYTVVALGGLLDGVDEQLSILISSLEHCQDLLGEWNDLMVHARWLGREFPLDPAVAGLVSGLGQRRADLEKQIQPELERMLGRSLASFEKALAS